MQGGRARQADSNLTDTADAATMPQLIVNFPYNQPTPCVPLHLATAATTTTTTTGPRPSSPPSPSLPSWTPRQHQRRPTAEPSLPSCRKKKKRPALHLQHAVFLERILLPSSALTTLAMVLVQILARRRTEKTRQQQKSKESKSVSMRAQSSQDESSFSFSCKSFILNYTKLFLTPPRPRRSTVVSSFQFSLLPSIKPLLPPHSHVSHQTLMLLTN